MRQFDPQSMLIAIALALLWTSFDDTCFATEPAPAKAGVFSIQEIEKDCSRLEETWKSGKRVEYFVGAAEVAERLRMVGDKREALRVVSTLLESLLAKKLDVGEVADWLMADKNRLPEAGYSDLSAMSDLAGFISEAYATEGSDFHPRGSEERMRNIKLLVLFLGRVRTEFVPQYEPKAISLNVVPPDTGGQFGFAGMSPNDIKDPAARAKYLRAIRENIANGISNMRQYELKALTEGATLVNELVDAFVGLENSSALLAECIKEARLTDKEKKGVESRLAEVKRLRDLDEAEDRKFRERIKANPFAEK